MGVIANLIVAITGSKVGLEQTLSSAKSDVKRAATDIKQAGGSGENLFSGLGQLGDKWTGLSSSLGGAVGQYKMLGPVMGGITGLIAAEVGAIQQLASHYKQLGREATNLGTTIQGLNRLEFIAKKSGSDKEGMMAAITRMQASVGEAMNDPGGAAAKKFAGLGIDPKKLGLLDAEEQFYKVAGAIANLRTHAQRTAETMEIFGRGARDMVGAIEKGEAGLRQMGSARDAMGQLSEEQINNLKRAGSDFGAWKTEVGEDWAALQAEIAGVWFKMLDGFREWVTGAKSTESAAKGTGGELDRLAAQSDKLAAAQAKAAGIAKQFAANLEGLRSAARSLIDKGVEQFLADPAHQNTGKSAERIAMEQYLDRAQYDPKYKGSAGRDNFEAMKERMEHQVAIIERWREQQKAAEEDAAEAQTLDAKHDPQGAYRARMEQLDRLRKHDAITWHAYMAETEEAKKKLDEALIPDRAKWDDWAKQVESPLERFSRQMEELDLAVANGLGKRVAGKMGLQAEADLARSMQGASTSLPDLLSQGTMEEYRARMQFQNQQNNPQKDLLEEARQQNAHLVGIQRAIEDQRQAVVKEP